MGVDGGAENIELSQEACSGGKSGERQEKHRKASGHGGPRIRQPFVVVDLDKAFARARQIRNQNESSNIHQRVSHQVVEDGGYAA